MHISILGDRYRRFHFREKFRGKTVIVHSHGTRCKIVSQRVNETIYDRVTVTFRLPLTSEIWNRSGAKIAIPWHALVCGDRVAGFVGHVRSTPRGRSPHGPHRSDRAGMLAPAVPNGSIYCSCCTFRRTVLVPSESEMLIFSSFVSASSLSTTFFCPPGFGGGHTSSNGGSIYFQPGFEITVASCLPQSVPPT